MKYMKSCISFRSLKVFPAFVLILSLVVLPLAPLWAEGELSTLDPTITSATSEINPDLSIQGEGVMAESSSFTQSYNQENLAASLTEDRKVVFGVDDISGAFNYSFPIVTPPGRNNLQPDLKLNYNNQQAGNSPNLIGYGWNINIPYIERINKTGTDKLYNENYFHSSL